jgi:hypothetical protein
MSLSTPKKNFSVKIEGIVETLAKFDLLELELKNELDKLLQTFVDKYHKEIYLTAPVDTSRYRDNWFEKKLGKNNYILYNSYANVVDPRGVHYADFLVYGISRFRPIASRYYYGNPATGALHDISLLNFEMTKRVVKPGLNDFVNNKIRKAEKTAGFAEVN